MFVDRQSPMAPHSPRAQKFRGRTLVVLGASAALVSAHLALGGAAHSSSGPTVKDQNSISRAINKHLGSGAKSNRSCWSFGSIRTLKGGEKRVRVTPRRGAVAKSGCSAVKILAEVPANALLVGRSSKQNWRVVQTEESEGPGFTGPESNLDLSARFLQGTEAIVLGDPVVQPMFLPLLPYAANNDYVLRFTREADQAVKTGSVVTSGWRSQAVLAFAVPPSCSKIDFAIKQELDNITRDTSAVTRIEVRELDGPIVTTGEMVWNRPADTVWRSSTESSISAPVKADGSQVLALFLNPTHEQWTTWSVYTVRATGLCQAAPKYGENQFEIVSATPLDASRVRVVARMTSAYTDGQRRNAPANTQVSFNRHLVRVGDAGLIDITARDVILRQGNFEYEGNTSPIIRCDSKECSWN